MASDSGGVKRIDRTRFLDERAGEARAAQDIASNIAQRSQYAAIHNQFVQVDLDQAECREVMEAAHRASEAAAHLRDVLEDIATEDRG